MNEELRGALSALAVPQAHAYRSHDFRRGHYEGLKSQGKRLFEILEAAGVRSPKAPRPYLARTELEMEAVMEAHLSVDSDVECD